MGEIQNINLIVEFVRELEKFGLVDLNISKKGLFILADRYLKGQQTHKAKKR